VTAVVTQEPQAPAIGEPGQDVHGYRGYMWLFFLLCAVGLFVAGWFGQALAFSGSHVFFDLIERQGFNHPFGRYSTAPFQFPALVASSGSSSVWLLRHLFGLGYAVAPFGALVVSWLVVRKRQPRSMVWPVIGVIVVGFPGLIGMTLESPMAVSWAWPLVLITLVGFEDSWTPLAAVVISLFLFFLSANTLGIFVMVAIVSVIRAFMEPALKLRLVIWAGVMAVAAPLEYIVRNKDFTVPAHKVSLSLVQHEFTSAYYPLPFVAYLLAAVACAGLLYLRFSSRRKPRYLRFLPASLVVIAGICLSLYAFTASDWIKANDSRDIILLLELPLFAVCVVDQLVGTRRVGPAGATSHSSEGRLPVILSCGLVLVVALGLWASTWNGLLGDTQARIAGAKNYCIPLRALERARTPLDNPYVSELAIALQSRTPAHVVISASGCRTLRDKGVLQIYEEDLKVKGGWFHFKTKLAT
jgi:hypothetical protein